MFKNQAIKINDKSNCCGCTSCEVICPSQAITMTCDEHGFSYPNVNTDKCFDCGLCVKVCPLKHVKITNTFAQKYYCARVKTTEDLMQSQSGGIAYALGVSFINAGGVVYGVVLDNDNIVKHVRIDSLEKLRFTRKSKYVQSDLTNIYSLAINDLNKGKHVLFTGVGCQIAGFLSLCRTRHIDTLGLLTVDILCHGVPSSKYWSDYIRYLGKTYKSGINNFRFRDKENGGWKDGRSSFILDNGECMIPLRDFYHPLLFRPSCYSCIFANFERVSDITLGDFWGIEKLHRKLFSDNKGCSLVLVNSQKGLLAYHRIADYLESLEVSREDCLQPQLLHPCTQPSLKKKWDRLYAKYGFEKAAKKTGIVLPLSLTKRISLSLRNKIIFIGRILNKFTKHFSRSCII